MKSLYFTAALSISLAALSITGCSKQEQPTQNSATTPTPITTLTIGYQKAALKLIVAKQNHFFEQEFPNVKVEWKEFPAGPQTLEALSVKSIDFGYTGDAPIVFALSAGKQLNYLGYEQAFNKGHAILTPKASAIQKLSDLKGKRIALTKGSSAHNFLAETLQVAHLTWNDIQPVWLTPSDARAALDKGAIDAWAVWEPYASATELSGTARVVFDSANLAKTYGFYLVQPEFVEKHPDSAKKILAVLNKTDQWIDQNKPQAAQILATSTSLNVKVANQVLEKKPVPNPVATLTPEVVQSQQAIGDLFFDLKLLPNKIDAQKAVWHAPQ